MAMHPEHSERISFAFRDAAATFKEFLPRMVRALESIADSYREDLRIRKEQGPPESSR